MDQIYIKTNDLASWIADRYFYGKDFITIEELNVALENLSSDYEMLEQKFEDLKRDVEDNYKPLTTEEQIGRTKKERFKRITKANAKATKDTHLSM